MKMKTFEGIFAGLILAGGIATAEAQTYNGLLLNHGDMTIADMYNLSYTASEYGTARSMAMGNAFTSLGADLVSMVQNPAGLGMYRSNAFAITPLLIATKADTDADAYRKNGKSRFSISNAGLVFNAYEGSGPLVSLNIGFGYNRLADYNYRYSYKTTGNRFSIADVFSAQLTWEGYKPGDLYDGSSGSTGRPLAYDRIYPSLWGAAMGYKCGLTDYLPGTDEWGATWIGQHADVGHYLDVASIGSAGEYDISLGANIGNRFYIGATIGIQSIYQQLRYTYQEDYVYGPEGSGLDMELRYADYFQKITLNGSGINFKIGMIYRPVDGLRIGMAVHSPTYYSIERTYATDLISDVYDNRSQEAIDGIYESPGYPLEDLGSNSWDFVSPTRLMFGLSYTFGDTGILSIDYERDWYNGIRVKNLPQGSVYSRENYNEDARDLFKGSNSLRAGAEFKVTPFVALRAGFGYTGSAVRDKGSIFTAPITRETISGSAGLGFRLSRAASLDLVYQYASNRMTEYYLFYADNGFPQNTPHSDLFDTRLDRHNIALTLGFRF